MAARGSTGLVRGGQGRSPRCLHARKGCEVVARTHARMSADCSLSTFCGRTRWALQMKTPSSPRHPSLGIHRYRLRRTPAATSPPTPWTAPTRRSIARALRSSPSPSSGASSTTSRVASALEARHAARRRRTCRERRPTWPCWARRSTTLRARTSSTAPTCANIPAPSTSTRRGRPTPRRAWSQR